MATKEQGGRKPSRTHQPHWKDKTVTKRQNKRREQLNQIAVAAGWQSWSAFETAAINGTRITPRAADLPKAAAKCDCGATDGYHNKGCALLTPANR